MADTFPTTTPGGRPLSFRYQQCYGCGDDNPIGLKLKFTLDAENARLRAAFDPRPEHNGAPGILHGGVVATVLDETMAALGYAMDGVHCVTATLDLKFRKPVPIDGRTLTIESWREHPEERRRQRVHGRLLLPAGEVAVDAVGIFVQVQHLVPE